MIVRRWNWISSILSFSHNENSLPSVRFYPKWNSHKFILDHRKSFLCFSKSLPKHYSKRLTNTYSSEDLKTGFDSSKYSECSELELNQMNDGIVTFISEQGDTVRVRGLYASRIGDLVEFLSPANEEVRDDNRIRAIGIVLDLESQVLIGLLPRLNVPKSTFNEAQTVKLNSLVRPTEESK